MGSKPRNPFYNPARLLLSMLLVGCLIGCLASAVLYRRLHLDWAMSAAVTFGMFAYHVALRFVSPALLLAFSHKRYNYRSWWFRPKPWEQRLYRFLKVKQWKGKAITYNPSEFSLKEQSIAEIINNMCHAELVHELIMVLSFTSLFFAIPFGAFPVFLITAILSAALDGSFAVIQRYNRPRLVRILEKQSKRKTA